jgi:hypothetical protein
MPTVAVIEVTTAVIMAVIMVTGGTAARLMAGITGSTSGAGTITRVDILISGRGGCGTPVIAAINTGTRTTAAITTGTPRANATIRPPIAPDRSCRGECFVPSSYR